MYPTKLTARRLICGGVLFAALGSIGAVSAVPAAAGPLVWGNAQAWVTDGDVVSGYSTAISFGGQTEGSAEAKELFGPMAEYLEIDGESSTVVDDVGARATSTVRTATFRMGVADLAAHGMIDVPPEVDLSEPSASPGDEPTGKPTDGEGGTPFGGAPVPEDRGDGNDTGDIAGRGDRTEEHKSDEPFATPFREPRETPPPSDPPIEGDEALILGGATSETVSTDGNSVEFTLADVTTTASAGYGGRTDAGFTHGDLTAFGVPVGPLAAGEDGYVVKDLLEVLDDDGDVALEVPVNIRFVVNETAFEDEDLDWRGRGVRSWMTVWVQVGEPEEEKGFAVDFADSWVLGSTHTAATPPVPGDKGDAAGEAARPDNRLATTGSSLAALTTAALVAVGGGSAATFLARKRTTAMDDQIED